VIQKVETDPQVEPFIQQLLDRSARQRLPALFQAPPTDALARLANREGVSVVAVRTRSLTHDQLLQILTYRLAQYILLRYFDPRLVYEARLQHEPVDQVAPDDVHVIAGDAETGEILCYVVVKVGPDVAAGTRIRAGNRRLFPVEQIYGPGIYNRLRILPDLPVTRVRELERFVKNQQRQGHDDLAIRAPVETVLAVFRLLATTLRSEVEAITGDLEEGVAKRNLDFFHVPIVIIHGVVPYVAPETYAWPAYQSQTRYPFAFLCCDIPLDRLDTIESTLKRPGKAGLIALLQLKAETRVPRSSLEPRDGLQPLDAARVPQQGVPMAIRWEALTLGNWLRSNDLFEDLSVAEASVLGTFLERCTAMPGDTILRQGELGDDLYLIEVGKAEVQVVTPTGHRMCVATLGPGNYFGEIALVTGGERTADVVALTLMRLLRLSRDAYERYLTHLVEVDRELTHTALERVAQTLRVVRSEEK
jgi:hypothetical protein